MAGGQLWPRRKNTDFFDQGYPVERYWGHNTSRIRKGPHNRRGKRFEDSVSKIADEPAEPPTWETVDTIQCLLNIDRGVWGGFPIVVAYLPIAELRGTIQVTLAHVTSALSLFQGHCTCFCLRSTLTHVQRTLLIPTGNGGSHPGRRVNNVRSRYRRRRRFHGLGFRSSLDLLKSRIRQEQVRSLLPWHDRLPSSQQSPASWQKQ